MSETKCETVRDAIPLYVGGVLDPDVRERVTAHLQTCADCREEAELVALLARSARAVPDGLSARIAAAVRTDRARMRFGSTRPWWGLAAAAVAAVALGIGVTSHRATSDAELPAYVAGMDADQEMWLSDDGLIAGAPALDDLSEDDLNALLTEMTAGGQA